MLHFSERTPRALSKTRNKVIENICKNLKKMFEFWTIVPALSYDQNYIAKCILNILPDSEVKSKPGQSLAYFT